MSQHQKSWIDRVGIDRAIIIMRAMPLALIGGGSVGLAGGAFAAAKLGLPLVLGAAVGFVGGSFLAYLGAVLFTEGGAAVVRHALQPDGSSTPYRHDFSQIESHVVRGDHVVAAELWEMAIVERPGDVEVRVRAGDFFAGVGARPDRALALFREVQGLPAVPPERLLYVSQRLVDLHLAPGGDKGRAVVELRRIIDRWPASAAARHGREALARLKAELHEQG